jgi:tyrosyl-tRNA synthetase
MTYQPKSEFLSVMIERGFVADCTDYAALDDALINGVVPAYIGYDATAKSLHVGHLMNIMVLRWLQKTGHKPITLMGGGTTKVGDPSFRSDERPLLDTTAIDANIDGMKQVFAKYLSYGEGDNDAVMLNNAEWLDDLNYLEFLRDIGRHFSVNRMLSFESVKSRLDREQSLSFLEFNYMILQAYDFLELNRRYSCLLQMGGSDQWGNIVNGIDLTRRVIDNTVFGLTTPLLTTSDGRKWAKAKAVRSGLTPICSAPMSSGNSGATQQMPTLVASSRSSLNCQWQNATAWPHWMDPRSTPPKSSSQMKSQLFATARTQRRPPKQRPAKSLKKVESVTTCPL